MELASDYGTAIKAMGVSTVDFTPYLIRKVTILERGMFTTACSVQIGEQTYLMSVDFTADQLGKMLRLGSGVAGLGKMYQR